jgi:glycosyltransferase involved in cell wall biosynthesis
VSVVIPVFNRPVTVRLAIQSVLAQTFQDFEIIVVDDGSTDETAESVSSFQDSRIRLIRHDRKRGGSAARNTGIRSSSGPYVAFLDSDDEWLPTKLERQLEVFGRSGDRLALVYTGTERAYADGTIRRTIARRYADLTRRLLAKNVVGETSVGMVRKSALDAVGGFDETLPSAQDLDLWVRLSERYRADIVPETLVRVAKGDDQGRISNNVSGTTRGCELFCRKHEQKMRQRKVLHIFLRYIGWMYLRSGRDRLMARQRYLDALAAEPIAPLTYVMLALTWLPMSWLDKLAHWKHRTEAVFQSPRASRQRANAPVGVQIADKSTL